jgi:hypothetical protein
VNLSSYHLRGKLVQESRVPANFGIGALAGRER